MGVLNKVGENLPDSWDRNILEGYQGKTFSLSMIHVLGSFKGP